MVAAGSESLSFGCPQLPGIVFKGYNKGADKG